MKITIFTSDRLRHKGLIKRLQTVSENISLVIESGITHYNVATPSVTSEIMDEYFTHVEEAEIGEFNKDQLPLAELDSIQLPTGQLSHLQYRDLEHVLKSDIYVVYGASYISGWLGDFLIENGAINIHMGLAPYYKGSSCNFWALYDLNPEMVGATIHLLSRKLDGGDVLFHVVPSLLDCNGVFDIGMKAVSAAQDKLVSVLGNYGRLSYLETSRQDPKKTIRYSKKKDFTDKVVLEFLSRRNDITDIIQTIAERRPLQKLNND